MGKNFSFGVPHKRFSATCRNEHAFARGAEREKMMVKKFHLSPCLGRQGGKGPEKSSLRTKEMPKKKREYKGATHPLEKIRQFGAAKKEHLKGVVFTHKKNRKKRI